MSIIRLLPFSWLLLGVASASAANSFTVTVDPAKALPDLCTSTVAAAAAAATSDSLTVTLAAKQKTSFSITVASKTTVLAAGQTLLKLADGAYTNQTLSIADNGRPLCSLILAPPVVAPVPPAGGKKDADKPAEPTPVDRTALAVLDQQGRAFLESKNITGHQVVKQSNFGRTFRLYHLPTGAPAFPLPRHVNEKDDVEIWTAVPSDATVSVEVSACDKIPAVRVSGTYKAANDLLSLQSNEEVAFTLHSHARSLSCAGTLTYKIDVARADLAASTTTSLAFDPVYRFEWGVGYMFDFGRPRKLSLGDRAVDDGMGGTTSEKFVIESDDYTGAAPIITLGVNVCGTNPAELTWCDRLLNPTLIVDPTRLTSGFGAGLTFRPFHGFGLLAGVTVFESTVLADGIDAKLGDPWSIAGDLPTKQVFNRDSLGFVLAAVISTDVFAELAK